MSVDAEFAKPGVLELIGRAGTQKRPQSKQQGYYFQISSTGAWTIFKSDSHTQLAYASVAALDIGHWHRLGFSFNGETVAASLDGKNVTVVKNNSYDAGQVGVGVTSYDTDQFDNLSITPASTTRDAVTRH